MSVGSRSPRKTSLPAAAVALMSDPSGSRTSLAARKSPDENGRTPYRRQAWLELLWKREVAVHDREAGSRPACRCRRPGTTSFRSCPASAPTAPPFLPVGSRRIPVGVQRTRNWLTVLYIQLSSPQVRPLCWSSTFVSRPNPVAKSSFLSALPSLFVSVNFQTSSAFDSFVSTAFAPNGITRGKHELVDEDAVRFVHAVVVPVLVNGDTSGRVELPVASRSCM